MSSKIILTRILQKAHANGYRCKSANRDYLQFSVLEFDDSTEQFSLKLTSSATTSVYHSSLSELVSDSGFLKAFFGDNDDFHATLATSRGDKLSYLSLELEKTAEKKLATQALAAPLNN